MSDQIIIRAESEHYNRDAKHYRETDNAMAAGKDNDVSPYLKKATSHFKTPFVALDLGCGTGRYFYILTKAKRIIGIDISLEMLRQARHPVNEEMISAKIDLRQGDLFHPPIKEGIKFDLIYSIGVLGYHAPFNYEICNFAFEHLKDNGVFFFSVTEPNIKKKIAAILYRVLPPFLKGKLIGKLLGFYYVTSALAIDMLIETGFSVEECIKTEFPQVVIYAHKARSN